MINEAPWQAIVVGGGPAGATCARLLALKGARVALLTRPRPARSSIGESLPPSCGRLFRYLGIADEIASRGFQTSTGNTVWWGEPEARVEYFEDGETGLQVSSAELEETLLALAEAAGAHIIQPATITDLRPPGDAGNAGNAERLGTVTGSVTMESEGHTQQLEAPWILDAGGRGSLLARAGLRIAEEGGTTLALGSMWRRPGGWSLPDPSHTLVESYADGWAWSMPLSDENRFFAFMVDPRTSDLDPTREAAALYSHEIAKTRAFSRLLTGATGPTAGAEHGPLVARDASTYYARRYAGPGWLLVGDAGSFIDPLSSYGVKKAMASGWLAAVCVHTCLQQPRLQGPALELFDRREREVYESYRRLSARYFDRGSPESETRFWSDRAALEAHDPTDETASLDIGSLREDPDVLAGLEALKKTEIVRFVLAPRASLEKRPMVSADAVVLADHLVSPQLPQGVRFLRAVNVPLLTSLADRPRRVPDLYEAYEAADGPVPLADFLGALAVCVGKGLLEIDEPPL